MKLNYYLGDDLLWAEVFMPCPGCGKMNSLAMHTIVISHSKNIHNFHIGCSCGWEGPEVNKAEQAAKLWDARAIIKLPVKEYL